MMDESKDVNINLMRVYQATETPLMLSDGLVSDPNVLVVVCLCV